MMPMLSWRLSHVSLFISTLYQEFNLLLPDVDPVIKDGVQAATGGEHKDGFENARDDRTAEG